MFGQHQIGLLAPTINMVTTTVIATSINSVIGRVPAPHLAAFPAD
jgi:hypothetical protein